MELTIPPSSVETELFHQSAEEAYESAVHNVLSPEGHRAVWREYIDYLRSKGVRTAEGFKKLLDIVQRCVLDVDWRHTVPPRRSSARGGEHSAPSLASNIGPPKEGEKLSPPTTDIGPPDDSKEDQSDIGPPDNQGGQTSSNIRTPTNPCPPNLSTKVGGSPPSTSSAGESEERTYEDYSFHNQVR